jgi:hypothetical protein
VVELKGGIKLARRGCEDYPGIRGRTDGRPYSGVTLGFYFGTGSKSSDLNEMFLMCYK